jgi:hypothetical protein
MQNHRVSAIATASNPHVRGSLASKLEARRSMRSSVTAPAAAPSPAPHPASAAARRPTRPPRTSLSPGVTAQAAGVVHAPDETGQTVELVGHTVRLTSGALGTVRFMGRTTFAPGDWVGIELDVADGRNDGSVEGVHYFRCPPRHGLFVRPTHVKSLVSRRKVMATVHTAVAATTLAAGGAEYRLRAADGGGGGGGAAGGGGGGGPEEAAAAAAQRLASYGTPHHAQNAALHQAALAAAQHVQQARSHPRSPHGMAMPPHGAAMPSAPSTHHSQHSAPSAASPSSHSSPTRHSAFGTGAGPRFGPRPSSSGHRDDERMRQAEAQLGRLAAKSQQQQQHRPLEVYHTRGGHATHDGAHGSQEAAVVAAALGLGKAVGGQQPPHPSSPMAAAAAPFGTLKLKVLSKQLPLAKVLRLALPPPGGCASFGALQADLRRKLRADFGEAAADSMALTLMWVDPDGDAVDLDSDEVLQEAVDAVQGSGGGAPPVLRLTAVFHAPSGALLTATRGSLLVQRDDAGGDPPPPPSPPPSGGSSDSDGEDPAAGSPWAAMASARASQVQAADNAAGEQTRHRPSRTPPRPPPPQGAPPAPPGAAADDTEEGPNPEANLVATLAAARAAREASRATRASDAGLWGADVETTAAERAAGKAEAALSPTARSAGPATAGLKAFTKKVEERTQVKGSEFKLHVRVALPPARCSAAARVITQDEWSPPPARCSSADWLHSAACRSHPPPPRRPALPCKHPVPAAPTGRLDGQVQYLGEIDQEALVRAGWCNAHVLLFLFRPKELGQGHRAAHQGLLAVQAGQRQPE